MFSEIIVKSKIKNYSLHFKENLTFDKKDLKIVDKNVAINFSNLVDDNTFVIECDENLKSWEGVSNILNWLLLKKANTTTTIIAIGGGVLQDAVSFCASIYCRGIDYILVPTTLLSQIDSCVGGKTSVNFKSIKNILGTFYPPKSIYICTDFLESLSNENYCSGLGELFKFDILRNKLEDTNILQLINDKSNILNSIYESLKYKISILEVDEFDKKERKYLNFGHTFGHALEITSNYKISHGYAVILGCLIALRISDLTFDKGSGIDFSMARNISSRLLKNTINLDKDWFEFDNLMQCVMSDKKNTGCLNMVLINNCIPEIHKIENYTIIKSVLEYIYEIV